MVRLFLALWLAVFALQTTDLLTVVAPDGCAESTDASVPDDCRDGCLRCVCCARVPVFVTQNPVPVRLARLRARRRERAERPVADPGPRAIYHVPKPSLA